ncbi:hypothetical protein G6F60_014314 [Rhizopus arrhizus]|nr:hypothetical protein G6F60_014314 [Rhizopus arrhizus]
MFDSAVVAHAAAVLAQHRVQVTCGGVQHARQHQVQLAALPVGQDQERRRRCDRTAQHGVDHARHDQHEAIADQVEAGQCHHRDGCRRHQVAVGAGEEEQQCRQQCDQQLHVQLREQLQQCPGQYQPGERADDALGQALAGGAEVGPAHEHDGQQHP